MDRQGQCRYGGADMDTYYCVEGAWISGRLNGKTMLGQMMAIILNGGL
jgi:hypothetical protein